jgi:hypothetical protein
MESGSGRLMFAGDGIFVVGAAGEGPWTGLTHAYRGGVPNLRRPRALKWWVPCIQSMHPVHASRLRSANSSSLQADRQDAIGI